MRKEYERLFAKTIELYPDDYSKKIRNYLKQMEQTVKSNSLIQINILNCFKEDYCEMIEIFPSVYRRYVETNFDICNLTDKDIEIICSNYVNEVRKIGDEYIK